MVRLQNLTNSTIKFQGVAIGAYGFADFNAIYDYVALSRLCGSLKARYFTLNPVPKKVEDPTKEEPKKVEEPIVEIKPEPAVEELALKNETVPEVVEEQAAVEEPKVEEVKKTTKRGKKGKNTQES